MFLRNFSASNGNESNGCNVSFKKEYKPVLPSTYVLGRRILDPKPKKTRPNLKVDGATNLIEVIVKGVNHQNERESNTKRLQDDTGRGKIKEEKPDTKNISKISTKT